MRLTAEQVQYLMGRHSPDDPLLEHVNWLSERGVEQLPEQFRHELIGAGLLSDAVAQAATLRFTPYEPETQTDATEGRKYDSGKDDYSLIPPKALAGLVRVLTFGARKYARDNWRFVPDRRTRYFSAAMRHMWAWFRGEKNDPETGENHLHHAACCISFLADEDEDKQ